MYDFEWNVPKGGYMLTSQEGYVPEFDDWGSYFRLELKYGETRVYRPFDSPGLFRTFAALDLSPQAILAFADRYGHLGIHTDIPEDLCSPREARRRDAPMPYAAQELGYPQPEVSEDNEQIQPEDEWWRDATFTYSLPEPLWYWGKSIEAMQNCIRRWDEWRAGDTKAKEDLLELVNSRLGPERVRLCLRPVARSPRVLQLGHVPENLDAALWTQLAAAIADNKEFRECPGCHVWFELSPQQYRVTRKYCSDACKSQAYRDRKLRAARMAKAGSTPREIAEMLHTTPTLVKQWQMGK